MDLTVLERQKARLTCLQQQDCAYSVAQLHDLIGNNNYSVNGDIVDWSKRPEQYQGMSNLSKFGNLSIAGTEFVANMMDSLTGSFEMDNCLSRTSSCQVAAVEAAMIKELAGMEKEGEGVTLMKSTSESNNLSKRKVEFVVAEEWKDKRIKGEVEKETKVKEKSSSETSADTSKENSKASEIKKADFIHVRARRGQATDSHSLAERARREKISKKMKCLQDLVPGCNKITGKAGMLDEIINYVQSLQRQVEFLSMKLAAQNPRLEFNIDNLFAREFPAYVASFPTATISSAMANLPYLQLNPGQQVATSCGLDMPMHPSQTATQENTSSSVSVPELCQVQPFSAWDADLQSLYNANNMGFH